MPSLEALGHEYRGRGLVVLDLTFPVLLDPRMETANAWRVPGVPATLVIRPGGEVVGMAIGAREWNSREMKALLERDSPVVGEAW
jgi:hypothetical protein